jgi:3-oxoacyl-[acyl-carrier-protein] synthase II
LNGRRVVITGLGAVTPLANTVPETWEGIINGRSGIGAIDSFDISPFATTFGGVIRNLDISQYIPAKDAQRMDGFIHYGLAAGCQAIEDSGIEVTVANAERIGVAIGSGIGGITGIEECYAAYEKGGHITVFCSRQYHQHDFRKPFDQIRDERAKFCHCHRLRHWDPQYR